MKISSEFLKKPESIYIKLHNPFLRKTIEFIAHFSSHPFILSLAYVQTSQSGRVEKISSENFHYYPAESECCELIGLVCDKQCRVWVCDVITFWKLFFHPSAWHWCDGHTQVSNFECMVDKFHYHDPLTRLRGGFYQRLWRHTFFWFLFGDWRRICELFIGSYFGDIW